MFLRKLKYHRILVATLICLVVVLYHNTIILTTLRSAIQQTISFGTGSTTSGTIDCVVNDGRAIAHDKDPDFQAKLTEAINHMKGRYDEHEMPIIQTIGPSFYFLTTDPRNNENGNGKNWPALSRAWNRTYAITDDESVISASSDIWGSLGLGDEVIKRAMQKENDGDVNNHKLPVRTLPSGKYAAFSGWYVGNFGHFVHDHVSKIAWLKSLVSEDTMFLLPYHELHETILKVVDEDFVQNRIMWVQYDETVYVTEGSLTVMIPRVNYPFQSGFPQTGTKFTQEFRRWLEESHWRQLPNSSSSSRTALSLDPIPKTTENQGKVIFYTRKGTTVRRVIEEQLEDELLQKTREMMVKHGRNVDDLIIFSGNDEEGNTLPMKLQFDLFSSSDTVIGPHGSGLTNVIWMDPRCLKKNRPKVLEFVSSQRSPKVQNGSYWGYWFLFGSLPWIDYHQIYYTENSDDSQVFIDVETFETTLDTMWDS